MHHRLLDQGDLGKPPRDFDNIDSLLCSQRKGGKVEGNKLMAEFGAKQ